MPRAYQRPAWDYLERGGKHAELVWHRRSGKDEIALHRTAVAAFERQANYWHMLPEYAQARKAIWDAVDPHTGQRRIDKAFPHELRQTTREQEMQIVFKNGSTWQVVGSDNYNRLVGSTPAGVVYSEWALANPSARAYLRPILAENNGWQIFITTPRGRNHAHTTLQAALKSPTSFGQVLTAYDTSVISKERLDEERQNYINEFGETFGRAMFEQEYLCSFDAAILGAFYGDQIAAATREGRITKVEYDPTIPVHTAWDLGWSDDTAIWWYQVVRDEIHILECHSSSGYALDYYADLIKSKPYKYGINWLPHDARAKTLASGGKSIQEQLAAHFGWDHIRIVPDLSIQDGIQAVRAMFSKCWFDESCDSGVNALAQYQREYDDDKKCFKEKPLHDWTSHYADAFRMLAIAWREEAKPKKQEPTRWATDLSINELIKRQAAKRRE